MNPLLAPGPRLLGLATAGSIDDGKSTLNGRLLSDSEQILADQLAAVERTSRRLGDEEPDLSLLTDGLRAEREQGITIDARAEPVDSPYEPPPDPAFRLRTIDIPLADELERLIGLLTERGLVRPDG